jgi:hypothetical protein
MTSFVTRRRRQPARSGGAGAVRSTGWEERRSEGERRPRRSMKLPYMYEVGIHSFSIVHVTDDSGIAGPRPANHYIHHSTMVLPHKVDYLYCTLR